MSKQIAVTGIQPTYDGAFQVAGVFWLATPASMVEPDPEFQSRVPFIDPDTLAALQRGTLTEQWFETGQYNADATLDFVQADLIAQYGAAQEMLTENAPALVGLVGTLFDGSSWNPA